VRDLHSPKIDQENTKKKEKKKKKKEASQSTLGSER
jgi:hypothetical protein